MDDGNVGVVGRPKRAFVSLLSVLILAGTGLFTSVAPAQATPAQGRSHATDTVSGTVAPTGMHCGV